MTSEEVAKTKYAGFTSTKEGGSSSFSNKTKIGFLRSPNQTINNLTASLTDPVYRLHVDKIIEANTSHKSSKSQ